MWCSIDTLLAELTGQAGEAAGEPLDWLGVGGLCAAGLTLLGVWLWRYGGPKALAAAPVRRHAVSPGLPFLLFFAWALLLSLGNDGVAKFYGTGNEAAVETGQNLITLLLNILMITVMLLLAGRLFARRLKGFGLNPKTLAGDVGWALVNLASVYPIIIGGIGLVFVVGRLLKGDDFTIQTHQSLEELAASKQVWFRVLVVVLVVGVVPVMEEMLFRGLMQSSLRTLLPGVWPAILMTSALFATVHYSTHIVSIFALSCCLGYAYERSGSLFRPIAIHALFNAVSVAAALYG